MAINTKALVLIYCAPCNGGAGKCTCCAHWHHCGNGGHGPKLHVPLQFGSVSAGLLRTLWSRVHIAIVELILLTGCDDCLEVLCTLTWAVAHWIRLQYLSGVQLHCSCSALHWFQRFLSLSMTCTQKHGKITPRFKNTRLILECTF